MTTKERHKYTREIIEFMGGNPPEDPRQPFIFIPKDVHGQALVTTGYITIDGCRYHESWDWLMPVIRKTLDMGVDGNTLLVKINTEIENEFKYISDVINNINFLF